MSPLYSPPSGSAIPDGTIGTADLADNSVTDAKASESVRSALASGRTAVQPGGYAPLVVVFLASGTFIKPSGYSLWRVSAIGPGGPGGSGARYPVGTAITGGGSGGGGGYSEIWITDEHMPSSVTVTIGASGTPGASILTNGTAGNGGTNSGSTLFGNFLRASGGFGGGGGSQGSAGAAGTAGSGVFGGAPGVASSSSGAAGNNGNWYPLSASGGAGGGITAAGTASAGGTGGQVNGTYVTNTAGGVVGGALPGNGAAQANTLAPGGAGGGGAAARGAAAQAGGTSGVGAGGAGGGASEDGYASGAGSAGGASILWVIGFKS